MECQPNHQPVLPYSPISKSKFLIVTKESLSIFYYQNAVEDHNIKTANKSLKQGGKCQYLKEQNQNKITRMNTFKANEIQRKLSAIQLRIIFSPSFIKKWKD
jgi:hypothetical protein